MKKKTRKEQDRATLVSVQKEFAKPRMARSAWKEEMNLRTAAISEHSSTAMPGIVNKIVRSLA
jgi:hypothetical protein